MSADVHLYLCVNWLTFSSVCRDLAGNCLTHWGWVTHICVSRLTIIGSDNGLLPGRRQAIIWTNAGILLIGPLGTNFSENLIKINIFSFMKMPLKMSFGKRRPYCEPFFWGLKVWTTHLMRSSCWKLIDCGPGLSVGRSGYVASSALQQSMLYH